MRTHLFRLFILLGTCLALSPAWAWPDKPVRLVIPYPPGAMGDTVSRLVAEDLRARLGQPIVIDNRPGAGGNIGSAFVAQSTDGHTFLVAATNNLVINQFLYRQMPDPLKAFVPVAILVDVPSVIFINAAVPATSFREFADHAKNNPGRINYASPGSGTTIHMLSEVLNKRFGLGMAHIAYKGAAPALAGLQELGAIPSTANPDQLPRQLEQEARFWGRTVQELGVQVD